MPDQDLGFLGMRATGDWPTNVEPENFRMGLLLFFPNGRAPLTAINSAMGSQVSTSHTIHWFTKTLVKQRATGTAGAFVYDDAALSVAYSAASGVADTVVYVKVTLDESTNFRVGHDVLLRDANDYAADTHGEVSDVVENGSSSYVAVKLDEADQKDLAAVDTLLVIGSSHAEGAAIPEALSYDPEEFTNIEQIFRNALDISGSEIAEETRIGDPYLELKREALQYHGIEIEKATIHGKQKKRTGPNGKRRWKMDGVISIINTHSSDNVDDYALNTDYSGLSWIDGGDDWLDQFIYQIFDFGDDSEKLGLAGREAMRGINRLAKAHGIVNLEPMTTMCGMKVVRWTPPVGDICLKTHPLFSFEATDKNTILIIEPKLLMSRPKRGRDTHFRPDILYQKGGYTGIDGRKEEWLTEMSMEYHNPLAMGILRSVGLDNNL
jgi:hypothetical protein